MTVPQQLLNQIRSALGSSINPNLTTQSKLHDLYEAYIFSFLIEAAKRESNVKISYFDTNGEKAKKFIFRTSPGQIFNGDYTHAIITFLGKKSLEAHIGVRVSGTSKVLHECDILLLEHDEAKLCRDKKISPRASKVVLAAECKYYSPQNFGIKLAREFMGLTNDFPRKLKYHFVYNTTSKSVEELLAHHKDGLWFRYVLPNQPNDVSLLKNSFINVIRNFIAMKKYSRKKPE